MSDIPADNASTLDIREQIARIDRNIAEQAKLRDEAGKMQAERDKLSAERDKLSAEQFKFQAEQLKLVAEEAKLRRDRGLAPFLAVAAVTAGITAVFSTVLPSIIRALAGLP